MYQMTESEKLLKSKYKYRVAGKKESRTTVIHFPTRSSKKVNLHRWRRKGSNYLFVSFSWSKRLKADCIIRNVAKFCKLTNSNSTTENRSARQWNIVISSTENRSIIWDSVMKFRFVYGESISYIWIFVLDPSG